MTAVKASSVLPDSADLAEESVEIHAPFGFVVFSPAWRPTNTSALRINDWGAEGKSCFPTRGGGSGICPSLLEKQHIGTHVDLMF